MKKTITLQVLVFALVTLFVGSSLVFAKEHSNGSIPPGLQKGANAPSTTGLPAGWSQGKKEGWKGANLPPGLAKKGVNENTPPGWTRGKKKGWKGATVPPGLAKKQ